MTAFEFAPGGEFAYRPGELLVRRQDSARAMQVLERTGLRPETSYEVGPLIRGGSSEGRLFDYMSGLPDTLETLALLHEAGVAAQPNHVLFATGCCDPCGCAGCPPHPADPGADDFYKAHPFYARPFYARPFYARPFYARPFYARPFYARPFYARVFQNPGLAGSGQGGPVRSSAEPVVPEPVLPSGRNGMRVAIVDTGYSDGQFPASANVSLTATTSRTDEPDSDTDGFLDVVAGHGTFIVGVIEQRAAGCRYDVRRVIAPDGSADEVGIAGALQDLAALAPSQRPHFVNMSFAGYGPPGSMGLLAEAVADLQALDVVMVASAGNEATCVPTYPGSLPGVIAVGALDGEPAPTIDDAKAAEFTNYGPWIEASAPGVDIESIFFNGFTDSAVGTFAGARWSGTSFAAPRVVGALAARADKIYGRAQMNRFEAAKRAVDELIYGPNVVRKPMLGAIVL